MKLDLFVPSQFLYSSEERQNHPIDREPVHLYCHLESDHVLDSIEQITVRKFKKVFSREKSRQSIGLLHNARSTIKESISKVNLYLPEKRDFILNIFVKATITLIERVGIQKSTIIETDFNSILIGKIKKAERKINKKYEERKIIGSLIENLTPNELENFINFRFGLIDTALVSFFELNALGKKIWGDLELALILSGLLKTGEFRSIKEQSDLLFAKDFLMNALKLSEKVYLKMGLKRRLSFNLSSFSTEQDWDFLLSDLSIYQKCIFFVLKKSGVIKYALEHLKEKSKNQMSSTDFKIFILAVIKFLTDSKLSGKFVENLDEIENVNYNVEDLKRRKNSCKIYRAKKIEDAKRYIEKQMECAISSVNECVDKILEVFTFSPYQRSILDHPAIRHLYLEKETYNINWKAMFHLNTKFHSVFLMNWLKYELKYRGDGFSFEISSRIEKKAAAYINLKSCISPGEKFQDYDQGVGIVDPLIKVVLVYDHKGRLSYRSFLRLSRINKEPSAILFSFQAGSYPVKQKINWSHLIDLELEKISQVFEMPVYRIFGSNSGFSTSFDNFLGRKKDDEKNLEIKFYIPSELESPCNYMPILNGINLARNGCIDFERESYIQTILFPVLAIEGEKILHCVKKIEGKID
jgi:hypothetical protein